MDADEGEHDGRPPPPPPLMPTKEEQELLIVGGGVGEEDEEVEPRSRRVGITSPPPDFRLSECISEYSTYSLSSSTSTTSRTSTTSTTSTNTSGGSISPPASPTQPTTPSSLTGIVIPIPIPIPNPSSASAAAAAAYLNSQGNFKAVGGFGTTAISALPPLPPIPPASSPPPPPPPPRSPLRRPARPSSTFNILDLIDHNNITTTTTTTTTTPAGTGAATSPLVIFNKSTTPGLGLSRSPRIGIVTSESSLDQEQQQLQEALLFKEKDQVLGTTMSPPPPPPPPPPPIMSFSYFNRSIPTFSVLLDSLNPGSNSNSNAATTPGGTVKVVPSAPTTPGGSMVVPQQQQQLGQSGQVPFVLSALAPTTRMPGVGAAIGEDDSSSTSGSRSSSSTTASSVVPGPSLDTSKTNPTSLPRQPPTTTMSKRNHALHELLSSERNYASDLALIRDVHIPLALGQTNIPLPTPTPLPTPNLSSHSHPSSSNSSSRTLSTASDSSAGSSSAASHPGPPMTLEDTKIIFNNVPELAVLADRFSEQLEDALGSVLEGGNGEDRVGALFLQIIPSLEGPYKYYITRHSQALAHLSSLSQTPALTAYLAQTQTIASVLSHAWDIQSLLIKPVQRLLKYSLLLSAIMEETPDEHGDKKNLRLAKERMDEVARGVNEGRRRWEVVKGVLASTASSSSSSGGGGGGDGTGGGGAGGEATTPPKKKGLNVGTAASVNLTKIKSGIKAAALAAAVLEGKNNEEAIQVAKMEQEIKRMSVFMLEWAKAVMEWTKATQGTVMGLRIWALGFGKVLGLLGSGAQEGDQHQQLEPQNSEAFDAFVDLVEGQLMPLSEALEVQIKDGLLVELARLRNTKDAPLRLLAAMKDEEPAHYHLLTMNVSKNRPAPGLLESSQRYLALRGQLYTELPLYLKALHRGIAVCVMELARIQARFWENVRDQWGDLWDALRVEGEMNAGADETLTVWWSRWQDVEASVAGLNIVNPKKVYVEPAPGVGAGAGAGRYVTTTGGVAGSVVALQQQQQQLLYQQQIQQQQQYQQSAPSMRSAPSLKSRTSSSGVTATLSSLDSVPVNVKGKKGSKSSSGGVAGALSSLEPSSPPQPSSTSVKSRGRGNSDASSRSGGPKLHKRRSSDLSSLAIGLPLPLMPSGMAYTASSSSMMTTPTPMVMPASTPTTATYGMMRPPTPGRANGTPRPDSFESYVDIGSSYAGAGGIPSVAQGQSSSPPQTQAHSMHTHSRQYSTSSRGSADAAINARIMMGSIGDDNRIEEEELRTSSRGWYLEAQQAQRNASYLRPSKTSSTGNIKMMPTHAHAKAMGAIRPSSSSGGLVGGGGTGGGGGGGAYGQAGTTSISRPRPIHDLHRSSSQSNAHVHAHTHRGSGQQQGHGHPVPHAHGGGHPRSTSRSRSPGRAAEAFIPSTSPPNYYTTANTPLRSRSPVPHIILPRPYEWQDFTRKPAKYKTRVIHPCKPPKDVSYQHMPFFTLKVDKVFDVLYEAGHPSLHEDLPLHVDDGEDCLLLVRNSKGEIGWALASFLVPLE